MLWQLVVAGCDIASLAERGLLLLVHLGVGVNLGED